MKKNIVFLVTLAIMLGMFSIAWATTYTIGTGTSSSGVMPIYTYYGYSYSQQIFTQAQIGVAGDITKLRFYYSGGPVTNSNAWVVYMGHTTKTAFMSLTDWVLSSAMTTVYNGSVSVPSSAGWMEITLTTPFAYNNADNLVIAVDENTPGWASSGALWGSFSSGANTGIYYYNDYGNPNPASPSSATAITNVINRIQLDITPLVIANPNAFTATTISDTQIDLSWERNATPDSVMVARNTTNIFGTPTGSYVVGNTISGGGEVIYKGSGSGYNDTGRTANTPYYYKAWSLNGGAPTYSSGVDANATTEPPPILSITPSAVDFGNQQIGSSSATQVIIIKNNGGGVLSIGSVTPGGVNLSQYDVTDNNSYPVNLHGEESITISAIFSPLTIGVKNATLSVVHDQAGSPTLLTITGTGIDTISGEIPIITSIYKSDNGIIISWDGVTGASYYNIYRSLDPYANFTFHSSAELTIYEDTDTSTKYFYRVTAEY